MSSRVRESNHGTQVSIGILLGLDWGYIGIMEKKMETTIVYWYIYIYMYTRFVFFTLGGLIP